MTLYIILGVLWYIIGFYSYYWWWTSEYDFELENLFQGLFVGFLGVLAYPIGYIIHNNNRKVLFKRRVK